MSNYETIIVGSSPNALTAAAYLARAGERVLVLEPTAVLGGIFSTREFAPGFHADTAFMSGKLDESISRDLKLSQYGLEVVERSSLTSLLPDGKSFTLPADRKAAAEVIRKFSVSDAERYPKFMQLIDLASDFLRSGYSMTPQAHPPTATDTAQMMSLVQKLRGYGNREMTEVMRLLVMSVRDLMEEWFESPQLKGLLASVAIRGLTQGPFAGSTTFNLLHHCAIEDGFFRASAKGGVGAISQALAAAAKASGAELRTAVGTVSVAVVDGVATGVTLQNGEKLLASRVISDQDARQTFTGMVEPPEFDPEFNRAVGRVKYNGSVARVDLALASLPKFAGLDEDALKGTLVLAPSVAYLEKAFDAAKYGDVSKQPYLEVTIPSTTDAQLAPSGKHVLSVWLQYCPYRVNVEKEQLLKLTVEQLSQFAPELSSLITHSSVTTPRDFEEKFNLTEGHLYGGEMSLTQAFYLRPVPGFAKYVSPLKQLFLCGSATHPGGGVNGYSGRNLTKEVGVKELALA